MPPIKKAKSNNQSSRNQDSNRNLKKTFNFLKSVAFSQSITSSILSKYGTVVNPISDTEDIILNSPNEFRYQARLIGQYCRLRNTKESVALADAIDKEVNWETLGLELTEIIPEISDSVDGLDEKILNLCSQFRKKLTLISNMFQLIPAEFEFVKSLSNLMLNFEISTGDLRKGNYSGPVPEKVVLNLMNDNDGSFLKKILRDIHKED